MSESERARERASERASERERLVDGGKGRLATVAAMCGVAWVHASARAEGQAVCRGENWG